MCACRGGIENEGVVGGGVGGGFDEAIFIWIPRRQLPSSRVAETFHHRGQLQERRTLAAEYFCFICDHIIIIIKTTRSLMAFIEASCGLGAENLQAVFYILKPIGECGFEHISVGVSSGHV